MKIPTKLVSAAAVAAVTLMSAGCGGSTTPVETFAEAEDPVAADSTAWESVKKGLNAMWGSTDCLYSRSVPPASQDAPMSIRLTAWRGERVSAQAVLWSASGAQSVVCATDDFTSDGATLPAGIATARFVRYTIADKSDPKCVCPRPQNHPAVLQPDMLDSLDRFDMAARTTRPVWITVNVPADAPAGIYRSQITVTRGDGCGKIRLPFELEVQDRLLPPPTEWRYHLDLWQHPAAVARAEGVELWSDAHFEALVVLKFIAGLVGRSSAMIADAVHSLSDFATDVVVLLFVRISRRPQDASYDYGYGKYETIATLIIGMALLVVGAGIAYSGGSKIYEALHGTELEAPSALAFWMAIISIAAKEACYRFTVAAGRKVGSQAVIANAWHHRSDAFSSIGTAIGIGGAIILGPRWRILDPAAAVIVSLFIIKVAVQLLRESFGELAEKSLPPEVEQEIIQTTESVDGVSCIHNLRTRRIGNYLAIEMHVRLDGSMTLAEAHERSSLVERRLKERYGAETYVSIHVEPLKNTPRDKQQA